MKSDDEDPRFPRSRRWGVNVHFTDDHPDAISMLAPAFGSVRMGFRWDAIETAKGHYDFTHWGYDKMVAQLAAATPPVAPYFIFDCT